MIKAKFDGEKILDFIKERGYTKKQFAKECKMSIATLNKILSGNMRVNTISVCNLCDLMQIKIQSLIIIK